MFFKFVKILRLAQKVLVVALSLVVGIIGAINHHMASGEATVNA